MKFIIYTASLIGYIYLAVFLIKYFYMTKVEGLDTDYVWKLLDEQGIFNSGINMTEYDMAKWLAENHEFLNTKMKPEYSEEQKLKWLIRFFMKEHPNIPYDKALLLFNEERIQIVLDRYYLKPLH